MLYVKRLKGRVSNVGLEHPSVFARKLYNPILEYLDSQYRMMSRGRHMWDINAMYCEWKPYHPTWNWWNVDFGSIALSELRKFKDMVSSIRTGAMSMSDPYVRWELYKTGQNCAVALTNDYLQYAFLYEVVVYRKKWSKRPSTRNWSMEARATNPFYQGSDDDREHYVDPDNPYTYRATWVDYLLPWNWGKSKIAIEGEHELEKIYWLQKTEEAQIKAAMREEELWQKYKDM